MARKQLKNISDKVNSTLNHRHDQAAHNDIGHEVLKDAKRQQGHDQHRCSAVKMLSQPEIRKRLSCFCAAIDRAALHSVNHPSPLPPSPIRAQPVTHYENFPVASWLCPPALRQPIAAIYAFARAADDIADEGDASPQQRLEQLNSYRQALHACAQGHVSSAWSDIFGPLQYNITQHALPVSLLDDLISAFIQDIEYTRDARTYANRAQLLDYCSRSANPVGRLLLHLYGVHNQPSLERSDAICSALQLINFWQDLSEDIPRGRHYLTDEDCAAFGVTRQDLAQMQVTPEIQQLIASNADWARASMQKGSDLVHQLPGRIGWELRLVVQGGLCILNKVDALQGRSLHTRRTVSAWDAPGMLWRAVRM